jgi:hypothetical protein
MAMRRRLGPSGRVKRLEKWMRKRTQAFLQRIIEPVHLGTQSGWLANPHPQMTNTRYSTSNLHMQPARAPHH